MDIREERLRGGHPCLRFGQGPPLVVLPGLTATHTAPAGFDRRGQTGMLRGLAAEFTVHWINRRPGLPAGTTMAHLADHYAEALKDRFAEPIAVLGISTGGSIALQLAIDRPELVSRLVVVCGACRLSDRGREIQTEFARLIELGKGRQAWAMFGAALATGPVARRATRAAMWLVGGGMTPDDPADLVRTIRAEDGFDATPDLHRVTAPTLVMGGEHDVLYPPELVRVTAEGIPNGRLDTISGGHMAASRSGPALPQVIEFLSATR